MPRRRRDQKSGGLMGRVAKRALKEAVGGRSSRSGYVRRYGPRPSHRLAYDSYDSDDYSVGGYGAPLIPYSRHSRHPSGGPLLSGPFGDQLKWKIGDYIVQKFANPKSLMALIPGFKGDDTSESSSDTSSSDSEDGKRSRRKPRKSSRRHDVPRTNEGRRTHRRSNHSRKHRDDTSLDSSEDEEPRARRRPQRNHHRSRRHDGDREKESSHRKRPVRRHDYRSRQPTRSQGRQGGIPPYAASHGVPYGSPAPYY